MKGTRSPITEDKVLQQRNMFAPGAGAESVSHLPVPTPAVTSGPLSEDLRLAFAPSLKGYSSTLGLGGSLGRDRSANPLTYSGYDSFSDGYDSYGYDLSYDRFDSFGSYGSKDEHRRRTRFHDDFTGFDSDAYTSYTSGYETRLSDLDRWNPWTGSSFSDRFAYDSDWSSARRRSRSELLRLAANRTKAFEDSLSTISSPVEGETSQTSFRIPRILHQTWKTDQVPAKFAHHLRSWRTNNPGWHFEFWDDHTSRELMAEKYPKHLRQYDRMSGIKRADIARLVALSVYGGVYADIDVEATSSLEPLLRAAEASDAAVLLGEENFVHSVLLERKNEPLVSNAVMIGAAGHAFWEEVLQEIFSKSWCEDPVQCTGPRIVDHVSWEHLRRNPGCREKGCVRPPVLNNFMPMRCDAVPRLSDFHMTTSHPTLRVGMLRTW
eukprot:symbB.v1.2.025490.t1/scaffold2475.1/size78315/9